MAKSISVESDTEELIAMQAIETYRALQAAVKSAPHGKGLQTVEAVVRDKGFDHLSKMNQNAFGEHAEAQKRGLQFSLRLRQERLVPPSHAQASGLDGRDDEH